MAEEAKSPEVDPMVQQDMIVHLEKMKVILPKGWELYAYEGKTVAILENVNLEVKHEFHDFRDAIPAAIQDVCKPYMKDLQTEKPRGKKGKVEEVVEIPYADEVANMTSQSGALSQVGIEALLAGRIRATELQIAKGLGRGGAGTIHSKLLEGWMKVRTMSLLEEIRDLQFAMLVEIEKSNLN